MIHERSINGLSACAGHCFVAGQAIVRGLLLALLLIGVTVRRIGHFVLLPYLWIPARWERSPLARASIGVARAAADATLIAVTAALIVTILW